jgi:hypothetical protein
LWVLEYFVGTSVGPAKTSRKLEVLLQHCGVRHMQVAKSYTWNVKAAVVANQRIAAISPANKHRDIIVFPI